VTRPPTEPRQAELPLADRRPREADGVIEGEVVRVTYESDETGFRVLRVMLDDKRELAVVGTFPAAPPGTRIRATGRRQIDTRHGEQFRAETVLTLAPATLEGLRRYLGSGLVPGVGQALAKRIVDRFGERTLEVLDRDPTRLREVSGLGTQRVAAIAKAWTTHRDIGAIMVFLQAHGVSPSLAARIHKRFGQKAMNVVSRSPYRLALDVWGIGFKTADAIARSIGIGSDSPERAQAGVLQILHDVSSGGHVYAERSDLVERASEMLECARPQVEEAIEALARESRVVIEPMDAGAAIYVPDLHAAEVRVASRLARLCAAAPPIPGIDRAVAAFAKKTGLELAPEQRAAVDAVARHKVVVVTGGPGVGKTTIVRAILAVFTAARMDVELAAPTGRAAKRLGEATGREAATLHRLLGFDPKRGRFQHDAESPLEIDAVIVDETSMVPIELADALLAALPDKARLVLVGDVDQLPSVGPGAVLRDIIGSGQVPTVRLTQVFRQAAGSAIVVNAHRIQRGEAPVGATERGEQFYLIDRKTPESAATLVEELVTRRIPEGFGLHPLNDVQVLTPMQKGTAGAIALNELLQNALNPSGPEVRRGHRLLRLGDKVMQLKNDYDKEVFNGDIGRITAVEPAARTLSVTFDGRKVDYAEGDLDELTLAYATSIHKSQGSEYAAVVVLMLSQHYVMLSRNLLYTAVTRGKRLVVLVSDPRAVGLALAEVRREERKTRLAERIVLACRR
jgi:exodeoxyribonuclease V alpha subunit